MSKELEEKIRRILRTEDVTYDESVKMIVDLFVEDTEKVTRAITKRLQEYYERKSTTDIEPRQTNEA